MTKKKYVSKVRQMQRNLARYAKENGCHKVTKAEEVNTPKWGEEILVGRHKGEILRSYQQAWDTLYDVLKDCDCMKGISQ